MHCTVQRTASHDKHVPSLRITKIEAYVCIHTAYRIETAASWHLKAAHHHTEVMSQQCGFIIYILLTVHLDVILVNDQLDALFLNVFISTPLHVSSSVLIIRRANLY